MDEDESTLARFKKWPSAREGEHGAPSMRACSCFGPPVACLNVARVASSEILRRTIGAQ